MAYSLDRELSVATVAIQEALSIAQPRFRTLLRTSVKDSTGDIVTDVDLLCEERITQVIRREFPAHAVVLEEAQSYKPDSLWTWIVDPLDGTNNYAYGLPLWGMSVALCFRNVPVLACIAEGTTGTLITAKSGGGVMIDASRWKPTSVSSRRASAAFWVGYHTDRESKDTHDLLSVLGSVSRRTFENWAPTIDVGLYLRGGLDVIVGKECLGTELPAVLLALREAGARIVDVAGSDVNLDRIPSLFIAGRGFIVDRVLRRLQQAALV
jgi:myo-inositol-1(or 4)-monophosphatase